MSNPFYLISENIPITGFVSFYLFYTNDIYDQAVIGFYAKADQD